MNKINLPKVLHSKTPKSYKNKKLNNANFGDFSHRPISMIAAKKSYKELYEQSST